MEAARSITPWSTGSVSYTAPHKPLRPKQALWQPLLPEPTRYHPYQSAAPGSNIPSRPINLPMTARSPKSALTCRSQLTPPWLNSYPDTFIYPPVNSQPKSKQGDSIPDTPSSPADSGYDSSPSSPRSDTSFDSPDGLTPQSPRTPSILFNKTISQSSSSSNCKHELCYLWNLGTNQFRETLSSLDHESIAHQGSMVPTNTRIAPQNLNIYYNAVILCMDTKKPVSLSWLEKVMKPLKVGHFFNDELFRKIAEHIELHMEPPASLSQVEVTSLAHILNHMASCSFTHPCLLRIAELCVKRLSPMTSHNFKTSLHTMRAITMLDASLGSKGLDTTITSHILEKMIENLNTYLAKNTFHPLSNKQINMIHWMKLYGYYLIQMEYPCPELPKGAEGECYSSDFQKGVEIQLRQKMPNIHFESEKTLDGTSLTADIYCEPGIVIEVDGKNYHHCFQLHLNDYSRNTSFHHGSPVTRENGKTVMKRRILEAAGYVVINISDMYPATLESVSQTIRINQI